MTSQRYFLPEELSNEKYLLARPVETTFPYSFLMRHTNENFLMNNLADQPLIIIEVKYGDYVSKWLFDNLEETPGQVKNYLETILNIIPQL
jgi:hypothetical protein